MINKKLNIEQKVKFIIDDNDNFKEFKKIDFFKFPKIFVFVDKKFFRLYKNFLKKIQLKKEQKIVIIKIQTNEKIKQLKIFEKYAKFLINYNCSKHDLIIAVGGGTILDLVGFLSSVMLRGIKLYLIPTNLIGMADASTAGKTGLNLGKFKNLIGTIYLPSIVYINPIFLGTCSNVELRQGWSEIFKYGLLGSRELIRLINRYFDKRPKDKKMILKIIKKTIHIRITIMKINPLASNLGHTFGHAIEKITNNSIPHGDAVSMGVVLALKFAKNKKLLSENKYISIVSMMKKIGLVTEINFKFSKKKLLNYMLKDKKSFDNKVGLILIKDIGMPYMKNSLPFFYCKSNEMFNFLKSEIK